MYRFNELQSILEHIIDGFKYNPCIGSIRVLPAKEDQEAHLNTTHVSVQ